eukprot:UN01834
MNYKIISLHKLFIIHHIQNKINYYKHIFRYSFRTINTKFISYIKSKI